MIKLELMPSPTIINLVVYLSMVYILSELNFIQLFEAFSYTKCTWILGITYFISLQTVSGKGKGSVNHNSVCIDNNF